jgi:hypothetical protein
MRRRAAASLEAGLRAWCPVFFTAMAAAAFLGAGPQLRIEDWIGVVIHR